MVEYVLTMRQARRFVLAHQGLWPPHELDGESGTLEFVRRVGSIQFDPLDVVGRNPDLVLQARVGDFRPEMLESLLYGARKLVDGWDKNASIYAVEDWPYFQRYRDRARQSLSESPEAVQAALPGVREAIQQRGPLSSIDLDLDRRVDWSWAPTRVARAALDSMHAWGELVIHHRVHTRKVYDFARRHMRAEILSAPDPNETTSEYHDWRIERRIGGLGLIWNRAGDGWLGMRGIKSRERTAAVERLLDQQRIMALRVEGLDPPVYMRQRDRAVLERVLEDDAPSPRAVILAPLDNLLWDRRFVAELFDFRYVWEVYKPADERTYGYYVLPILYGDRFVARFEPERDKTTGAMVIKNWWWEPGAPWTDALRFQLVDCFERFLRYLDANRLVVGQELMSREKLEWLRQLA